MIKLSRFIIAILTFFVLLGTILTLSMLLFKTPNVSYIVSVPLGLYFGWHMDTWVKLGALPWPFKRRPVPEAAKHLNPIAQRCVQNLPEHIQPEAIEFFNDPHRFDIADEGILNPMVGDRVECTHPALTFGEYTKGSLGVIVEVKHDSTLMPPIGSRQKKAPNVLIKWDNSLRRHPSLVFPGEYKVLGRDTRHSKTARYQFEA